MMAARPRHLHLIHSQDEPEEAELERPVYRPAWNWGMLLAFAGALAVWAVIIAGVVLLL
jgi:hypothetical protein